RQWRTELQMDGSKIIIMHSQRCWFFPPSSAWVLFFFSRLKNRRTPCHWTGLLQLELYSLLTYISIHSTTSSPTISILHDITCSAGYIYYSAVEKAQVWITRICSTS